MCTSHDSASELSLSWLPLGSNPIECPRKPNLLHLCLLICRFFVFSVDRFRLLRKYVFVLFVSQIYPNLSAYLLSFSSVFFWNTVTYMRIICQVFYLVREHDRFENVSMSTFEQIWLFSACGRLGTKFYVGSPLGRGKSWDFFLLGEIEGWISWWESVCKILYQVYHQLKKVTSAQLLSCWHFHSNSWASTTSNANANRQQTTLQHLALSMTTSLKTKIDGHEIPLAPQ